MIDMLLSSGHPALFAALALTAFADTLIGVGVFVFGELAFLTAGAMLASSGSWAGVVVVLIGAWAGDLVSFWLGRRYGARLSRYFLGRARRRRAWRRANALLDRYGVGFVVVSRLLGPVAWVTPFLAGSLGMSPGRFSPASALGVLLGGGQFVLLGALGLTGLDNLSGIWSFVADHWAVMALFAAIATVQVMAYLLLRQRRLWRLCLGALAGGLILVGTNLAYFFAPRPAVSLTPLPPLTACALPSTDLLATPGSTALHQPQPINVALISARPPEQLMAALGWTRNAIFHRGSIPPATFLSLISAGTPPVSELFFQGQSARAAFQLPGSLSTRVHIRWWGVPDGTGRTLYLGAISRDEELAIKYYDTIPAILHDIDPEVDPPRDDLARRVAAHPGVKVAGWAPLGTAVPDAAGLDYLTDGKVLILHDTGMTLSAAERTCLGL